MQFTLEERPRKLDEVIGQKVIVESFKERLQKDKINIPQAMILEGLSGCGKTSLVNIIATTMQCEKPVVNKEGYIEPCLTCGNCQDIIKENFSRDTHFIPASMENGKEVIANIEDLVSYYPSYSKYKIIIVGEIQNLTSSAKTALLELIEKPRKNVHFMFTTMDSSKIDKSVKDRCQVYKFKPVKTEEISDHLIGVIATKVQDDLPETFFSEVIPCISQNANGSVRNALSLLEQCIVSKLYTEKELISNIGIITETTIESMLYKLLKKDESVLESLRDIELEEFFRVSRYNLINALSYKIYCKDADDSNFMIKKFIAIGKQENLEELLEWYIKSDGVYFNKNTFIMNMCLYLKTKKNKLVEEVIRQPVERVVREVRT